MDTNLKDINLLQEQIMVYVSEWARHQKTPIPRQVVISYMKSQGVSPYTIVNALRVLKQKGYIRPAVTVSNKTSYVMLRWI